MPIAHQDHRGVAVAPSAVAGCLEQLFDLGLGQVFAGPQFGIGAPSRGDCPFFSCWGYQLEGGFHQCFPCWLEMTFRIVIALRTVCKPARYSQTANLWRPTDMRMFCLSGQMRSCIGADRLSDRGSDIWTCPGHCRGLSFGWIWPDCRTTRADHQLIAFQRMSGPATGLSRYAPWAGGGHRLARAGATHAYSLLTEITKSPKSQLSLRLYYTNRL